MPGTDMTQLDYATWVGRKDTLLAAYSEQHPLAFGTAPAPDNYSGLVVHFGLPETIQIRLSHLSTAIASAVPGATVYDRRSLHVPIATWGMQPTSERSLSFYWDAVVRQVVAAVRQGVKGLTGLDQQNVVLRFFKLAANRTSVVAWPSVSLGLYTAHQAIVGALGQLELSTPFVEGASLHCPLADFHTTTPPDDLGELARILDAGLDTGDFKQPAYVGISVMEVMNGHLRFDTREIVSF